MNTENKSPTLDLEIMPLDVQAVSTELSAPKERALAAFTPFQKLFAEGADLLAKERNVTTPTEANKLRLEMRKLRSSCKQAKDLAKADILLAGRLADAFFNRAVTPLQNSEARLEEIEKADEIRIAAEREARRAARLAELAVVDLDGAHFPLGEMLPEPYAQLLTGAKLAYQAKIDSESKALADAKEAERLAEIARIAKEKEEADAREAARIKSIELSAENARLQAEKAAVESIAKAEREKAAEAARIAAEERAAEAKKAADSLAAEKAKAKDAADAAAEVARKEAAEIARLAAIEKGKAEQAAAVARAEAKKLQDSENARLAAEKAAKYASDAESARAAAAPDKDKLAALAEKLKAIPVPMMETKAGAASAAKVTEAISHLIDFIREEYKSLGKPNN